MLIFFKHKIREYLLGMTVVSPGGAVMVTGMLIPVGPILVLFFRLSLSSGFSSEGDWRGLVARLSVPVGLPLKYQKPINLNEENIHTQYISKCCLMLCKVHVDQSNNEIVGKNAMSDHALNVYSGCAWLQNVSH